GPADGNALALTTGQSLGHAIEIGLDLQNPRRFPNPLIHLGFRRLGELQAKGHVVVNRHMRIERIGLKHHGDAALRGRNVVDDLPPNRDFAARDRLQSGDHPQRGLAAAGRSNENNELAGFDIEIDAMDDLHRAIGLSDPAQRNIGHKNLLRSRSEVW
ncbi:hypothetical protein BVRB_038370, partial [Beta vulgaris subsp. vulgaris]